MKVEDLLENPLNRAVGRLSAKIHGQHKPCDKIISEGCRKYHAFPGPGFFVELGVNGLHGTGLLRINALPANVEASDDFCYAFARRTDRAICLFSVSLGLLGELDVCREVESEFASSLMRRYTGPSLRS